MIDAPNNPSAARRSDLIAIGLVGLALIAFRVALAAACLPVLDGDASAFDPVAVNFRAGRGMVNPLFLRAELLDPGRLRLVWHAFGHAWLLGTLMSAPTAVSLCHTQAAVEVVGLALATALALRLLRPKPAGNRFWPALMAGAMLGQTALFQLCWAGRPEALVIVEITAAVLALCSIATRYHAAILAVAIGTVAVTDPVPAALAAMVAAIWLTRKRTLGDALGQVAAVWIGATGAAAVLTKLLYPYAVSDLIHGMGRHANIVFGEAMRGTTVADVLHATIANYVTAVFSPLAGVYFVVAALMLALPQIASGRVARSVCVFRGLLTVLFFAVATRYAVYRPEVHYLHALCPMLAALLLLNWNARDWPRSFAAVLAIVPCAGLAMYGLIGLHHARHGVSLAEVRSQYDRQLAASPLVGITNSLWLAGDDYDRMARFDGDTLVLEKPQQAALVQRIMFQQAATGLSEPPAIPGYRLIVDRFVRTPITLGPIIVSRAPKTFGYAVFAKTP